MPAKAARKHPPRSQPRHGDGADAGDDGETSPTKQLRQEAADMGRAASAEHAREGNLPVATAHRESKSTLARRKSELAKINESTAILRRLVSTPRKKKQGDVYVIPDEEDEHPRQRQTRSGNKVNARKHSTGNSVGANLPKRQQNSKQATVVEGISPMQHAPKSKQSAARWTTQEDDRLMALSHARASWPEMDDAFPDRTLAAIKQRYSKLKPLSVKRKREAQPPDERPAKKTRSQVAGEREAAITERTAAHAASAPGLRSRNKLRDPKNQGVSSLKHSGKASSVVQSTRATRHQKMIARKPYLPAPTVEQEHGNNWQDGAAEPLDHGYSPSPHEEDPAVSDHDTEMEGDADIIIPERNADIFGQTEVLIPVLTAALEHKTITYKENFLNRGQDELPAVKAIRLNKERIQKCYKSFASSDQNDTIHLRIDALLKQLDSQVKHLQLDAYDDQETKWQLAHQVNVFIFVDLLSLLSTAANEYTISDLDDDDHQMWQLDSYIHICQVAVNLYKRSRSKSWNAIKITGVRDIRTHMLGPLVKPLEALKRKRMHIARSRTQEIHRERVLHTSRRQEDADEQERRLVREYNEKYQRLRGLFARRKKAANELYWGASKLRMHGKNYDEWRQDREPFKGMLEFDANGYPMERLPIFAERQPGRGPPRTSTLNAEDSDWTRSEKYALLEGLRAYSGRTVFRDIFTHYCQPGQELSKRTVSEILRKAASIREVNMSENDDNQACPPWLSDLPDLDLIELL